MRRGLGAGMMLALAGAAMAPSGATTADTLQAMQAPQKLQATQASQPSQTPGASQTSPTQAPSQSSGQTPTSTQNAQPTATSHGLHFLTVTFDYDFSKTPACSATVKTACVQEFVAYDISAGVRHRTKLFEIPLPPKPVGLVPGITGKSPAKLGFKSGKHLISVVAREPDGKESKHHVCTTWIDIP